MIPRTCVSGVVRSDQSFRLTKKVTALEAATFDMMLNPEIPTYESTPSVPASTASI